MAEVEEEDTEIEEDTEVDEESTEDNGEDEATGAGILEVLVGRGG